MIVAMTGATGLIGKALGRRLAKEGIRVHALVRSKREADRTSLGFSADIFTWDGGAEGPPVEALRGATAVIHLAGENIAAERWTAQRKQLLLNSRIESAQGLKNGLERSGVRPRAFISASAVGIYGDRGDEPLNEQSALGTDFLARLCQQWEATALAVGAERTVLARFGVVLSPDGGFLGRVAPLFRRLGTSRLGSGQQWFSWIHIDDAVEVLWRALNQVEFSGPLNVVAPEPVTNQQLTEHLRLALAAWPALPVPSFALRLLYGELAEALLASQRATSQILVSGTWSYPTVQEAIARAFSSR